jgi:hypothetical protein
MGSTVKPAVSGLLQHLYSSSSNSVTLSTAYANQLSQVVTPKKIGSKFRITVSFFCYLNANYSSVRITQTGGTGTFSSNNDTRIWQNGTTTNTGSKHTETYIFTSTDTALNTITFNFQAKRTGGSVGVNYGGSIMEIEEIGV